jgi:hypothetical protein
VDVTFCSFLSLSFEGTTRGGLKATKEPAACHRVMSSQASAPVGGVSGTAHRRFVWNVVTVILAGTSIYAWAAYYSDSLPEITAVLGGGGLLIWATTAFSLLRKERQEEFWSWLEKAALSRRWVTGLLLVGFLALGVTANFLGSVQVECVPEEGGHSVSIYPLGNHPSPIPQRLDPTQPVRTVILTSWFSPRSVVVKVPGYPRKVVTVAPFHRVQISAPAALRSPVLLFRPSQTLADVAKAVGMRVQLTDQHGSALAAAAAFDGQAILTGGEDDITLSPEFEEKWRAEVPKRHDLSDRWATPSAPIELAALGLSEKQTLRVQILTSKNQPYGPVITVVVNTLRANKPFVQEVVLHGPE